MRQVILKVELLIKKEKEGGVAVLLLLVLGSFVVRVLHCFWPVPCNFVNFPNADVVALICDQQDVGCTRSKST